MSQYKLDDDIEFHNSAEPSTNLCPMLPGQLVNVLHVPYSFANGRSRNTSVSSAKSELRTLDPSDRYLNPRPAPKLPRLNTSPTFAPQPWSSTSSPVSPRPWSASSASSKSNSQPNSAGTTRKFRLPLKSSTESQAQVLSPSTSVSGLIDAFRSFRSARSRSPEIGVKGRRATTPDRAANTNNSTLQDQIEDGRILAQLRAAPSSRTPSRDNTIPAPAELDSTPVFALRKAGPQEGESDDNFVTSSFQQHRRQRSRSRGLSSLRNSLVIEEPSINAPMEIQTQRQPLDTLKEVVSPQNTPAWPITAIRIPGNTSIPLVPEKTPCLDKRLPTLPNTPSSAYPLSAVDSPSMRLSSEIANLESHFSSTTIDTASCTDGFGWPERSHFSDWTMATSPTLEDKSIVSHEEPDKTGHIRPDYSQAGDQVDNMLQATVQLIPEYPKNAPSGELPLSLSYSTLASTTSSSPSEAQFDLASTATIEDTIESTRGPSVSFQQYRLPIENQLSDTTLKYYYERNPPRDEPLNASSVHVQRHGSISDPQLGLSHSESMQQLLHELSYLSNMIQR